MNSDGREDWGGPGAKRPGWVRSQGLGELRGPEGGERHGQRQKGKNTPWSFLLFKKLNT